MLRVAVLGANGFIGTRTVEMLHLGDLAEPRPVVRNMARLARLSRFDLDCRIADGFDQSALQAAFHGCHVVVHAIAGDPNTIGGTLAPTYRAAQEAGVQRFIYLSTATVHGQAPEAGTDEKRPLNGKQLLSYNNAKVNAERMLQRLRTRGHVELVVLRPGIVFGPRSSWVTRFIEALLAGQGYMVNDGLGVCNSAYVDNLVHAIYLAMTACDVDREAFLIGDQERITWADFYQPFAEALGYDLSKVHRVSPFASPSTLSERLKTICASRPVQSILSFLPGKANLALSAMGRQLMDPLPASPWKMPEAPMPRVTLEMSLLHQCSYKLPFDKARNLLGYEPRVSFAEACRRTISWLGFVGYPVTNEFNKCHGAHSVVPSTR
jgi:2-alkyl-3-oxoalkanoate reductase